MYDKNLEMTVLIKGRPITEYGHRGQIFVEGRGGSEYEIKIRNKTGNRVEAVISVDGLSITDGKTAGPQSSGYMLNAYETMTIPGWLVDSNTGAKFAFSGKQDSYSTEMKGGDSRNNGVIGAMVFSEKYKRPVYTPTPWPHVPSYPMGGGVHTSLSGGGSTFGLSGALHNSVTPSNSIGSSNSMYASSSRGISASASMSASTGGHMRATKSFGKSRGAALRSSGSDYMEQQSRGLNDVDIQSLGTAFGEATEFRTKTVEFERGDMISMQVLRYDDAKGLKARGIFITRPSKQKYQTEPNAFPGIEPQGCPPPKGWEG